VPVLSHHLAQVVPVLQRDVLQPTRVVAPHVGLKDALRQGRAVVRLVRSELGRQQRTPSYGGRSRGRCRAPSRTPPPSRKRTPPR
jgi:hypothetical protein